MNEWSGGVSEGVEQGCERDCVQARPARGEQKHRVVKGSGLVGSEACSEPYASCFAVVVEALGDSDMDAVVEDASVDAGVQEGEGHGGGGGGGLSVAVVSNDTRARARAGLGGSARDRPVAVLVEQGEGLLELGDLLLGQLLVTHD